MPTLPDADPLLILAIVIVAGVAGGWLARRLRLPGITGQILIGVLIGNQGFFAPDAIHGLEPLTHFALSLMAVTVGAHLSLKRLRNSLRRLLLLLVFEATLTPLLLFGALSLLPGVGWSQALLLSAIAVSTAPATIVSIVTEMRARGVFVKTLVAAVALNNVACIVLFEVARVLVGMEHLPLAEGGLAAALMAPLRQVGLALLFGGVAGGMMQVLQRFAVRPETISTAGVLAILLTSGLSDHFGVSALLSCLFLGVVETNLTPAREKLVDTLFSDFHPAIMAVFFTLAGMELDLQLVRTAGLVGVVFFFARAGAKLLSVRLAMNLARATDKVRRFLGMALLPQAGLAIGLVLIVQDDPALDGHGDLKQSLLAVVLTVVTLNELIGPLCTKWALERSGEVGRDRRRLLDFIREENILVDFHAQTYREAIEKLVDHMIRSQHLAIDRATLLSTVLEREAQAPTTLGGGLAVPHAILPDGHPPVGAMGVSSRGLAFETPDGEPVHCIVLLGTSRDHNERHLQILATLARALGTDPWIQDRVFHATTAAHAAEVLHGEESEHFNVYLE